MRNFIVVFTLFLAGCVNQDLPENWAPLTTIVERPDLPNVSDTIVTTVSPRLFVRNLDDFWERHPEGSVQLEALRRHEVLHAKSQEEYPAGKLAWLTKYIVNRDFRWQEEKLGYREAWLYYKSKGWQIDVDWMAGILSGSGYNNMVTFEEAKQWISDVLAGRT